jgi:cell division septation protein DedD
MVQDRGYTAYLAEADIPGQGLYYRVRVGPFGTREEAAELVADMRVRLPKPLPDFWIVPADR